MVLRGELMKKKGNKNALSLLLVIGLSVSLCLAATKNDERKTDNPGIFVDNESI